MQNQNLTPYTVAEFADTFRMRIGDTSKSVPLSYIIAFVNTALRRLARHDGLDKLYERRDSWELSYLNKDGTPSAAWNLGNIGKIIDIKKMRVLKTVNGEVCIVEPAYKEYRDFMNQVAMPEQNTPGDPNFYTIEQIGSITRLLFNRPPRELLVLDMLYSAFFPRLIGPKDEIPLAWEYADILEEFVIILHKIETTDQSTARALWEDLDVLTAEAVEMLAKRKSALPPRMMRRSW